MMSDWVAMMMALRIVLISISIIYSSASPETAMNFSRPNVLLILADDLGYGDLSVKPFTGHGIKTPQLERMASSGIKMTNFHVAAPICTPSRASILTGLFPWRLGIYSIYGSGPQAEEYLAVVPTLPMTFLEAGYHTAHVGKWHLGGMKPSDLDSRRNKKDNCKDSRPGPHQHGYVEYVAMAEGPGSPRLNTMIPKSLLYHQGSQHLIRNEEPYFKTNDVLTDRQTNEGIRIMKETAEAKKNFFLSMWYDAPHGPWETIKPFDEWYGSKMWEGPDSRNTRYATMVSSLDANVGRLLEALDHLGIAENTLVVFMSDNGPEDLAGSSGPYKGRKRSLLEGGVRVPAIWVWKGTFQPGHVVESFGVSTDLFPTLLHAAGIPKPVSARLDGVSLLGALLGTDKGRKGEGTDKGRKGEERTVTWYKDIGGKEAAAWSHGYKLHGGVLQEKVTVEGLFDLRVDDIEAMDLRNEAQSPSSSLELDWTMKHRHDGVHLAKVRVHLEDRLNVFIRDGARALRAHRHFATCLPPNASQVPSLPWEVAPASVPVW